MNAYFRVRDPQDFRLRIYDRHVSEAPSTLQIRKLLVAQRLKAEPGVDDNGSAA